MLTIILLSGLLTIVGLVWYLWSARDIAVTFCGIFLAITVILGLIGLAVTDSGITARYSKNDFSIASSEYIVAVYVKPDKYTAVFYTAEAQVAKDTAQYFYKREWFNVYGMRTNFEYTF